MARKITDVKKEGIKIPSFKLSLKCKNQKQKEFANNLKDKEKEICFGIGSAGTGKTYISLSVALSLLKDNENEYKTLYVFVPTCESTKELSMGYLKGELQQKSEPYLQNSKNTIIKILEKSNNAKAKELTEELINKGFIQFVNLLILLKVKLLKIVYVCLKKPKTCQKKICY